MQSTLHITKFWREIWNPKWSTTTSSQWQQPLCKKGANNIARIDSCNVPYTLCKTIGQASLAFCFPQNWEKKRDLTIFRHQTNEKVMPILDVRFESVVDRDWRKLKTFYGDRKNDNCRFKIDACMFKIGIHGLVVTPLEATSQTRCPINSSFKPLFFELYSSLN